MHFENCPSHTELKVNKHGVFVIETSPRLGGGYITSVLTPLSTGINIEDQQLHIALGESINLHSSKTAASGVCFFNFKTGRIVKIDPTIENVKSWPNIYDFDFNLKVGDCVKEIKTGLDRYGYFICKAENRNEIDELIEKYNKNISTLIHVE